MALSKASKQKAETAVDLDDIAEEVEVNEPEAQEATEEVKVAPVEEPKKEAAETVETVAKEPEGTPHLVLLKGTSQINDPGTGVTLIKGQWVTVPYLSKWVKRQGDVYNYLDYKPIKD
ncbi:MAG: hypothetical protein PVI43_00060 [Candidatus Bathyarchaeota archaeon]|jgi:hypothetical protein